MNIDYGRWYLTLPIDKDGKFKGEPKTVSPLTKDFVSDYFYYDSKLDLLLFVTPYNGVTTENSENPRSELREMLGGKKAAWKIKDGKTLKAGLMVLELPYIGDVWARVVIGQFHGPSDELCRLYYDNGVIYFMDDKSGDSKKETKFILKDKDGNQTKIKLGDYFEYVMEVKDGYLTVAVKHNGIVYAAQEKVGKFWLTSKMYFYSKAGNYLQRKTGKKVAKSGKSVVGFRYITVS